MEILVLGSVFALGGLMFLTRFERSSHDRKTAVAVYGAMGAAALVVLIALIAFGGPVLSKITSDLSGMP